jgi:hypothetical protein
MVDTSTDFFFKVSETLLFFTIWAPYPRVKAGSGSDLNLTFIPQWQR